MNDTDQDRLRAELHDLAPKGYQSTDLQEKRFAALVRADAIVYVDGQRQIRDRNREWIKAIAPWLVPGSVPYRDVAPECHPDDAPEEMRVRRAAEQLRARGWSLNGIGDEAPDRLDTSPHTRAVVLAANAEIGSDASDTPPDNDTRAAAALEALGLSADMI